MDFGFDVNRVISDRIQKIEPTTLKKINTHCKASKNDLRWKYFEIIDRIGEASGKAQALQAPVTTSEKFATSDHIIYLMKDPDGNRGHGSVVGLLKTGRKKLFLIDSSGNQNELLPLCILDFYVHESQQRKGFGKQLFEFMLEDEKIEPHSLAIDRPSSKFIAFLRKHYNLVETIPQVNNFTIFKGFFKNISTPQHLNAASHRFSDPPGLLSFQLRDPGPLEHKQMSKSVGPNLKTESKIKKKEQDTSSFQNQQREFTKHSVLQDKTVELFCCNRGRLQLGGSSNTPEKLHQGDKEKPNYSYPTISPSRDDSRKSTPNCKQDYPLQLSSGRTQATRDSSLNIFGIPAGWNQCTFSSKPQETL